jgi:Ca2+-binding RTX toxin-like protein
VVGLGPTVTADGFDARDLLDLRARGGDDIVIAVGAGPGVALRIDGGDGDDAIVGGEGHDTLIGGAGDDDVRGEGGDDVVRLGAGDDVFGWDGDDGSDRVDGGAGDDEADVVGAGASEAFRLGADGQRALLTRDLDDVRLSLTGVEAVVIRAGDGADRVEISDLTATKVRDVFIEMNLSADAGDGAADLTSLTGGAAAESIDIVTGGSDGSQITVFGLPAEVTLSGVEAADTLSVSGGGGGDILRAREVAPGQARLILDGGAGDDFVFGGENGELVLGGGGDDALLTGGGDDTVSGGRGDDFARLGAGDDLFGWLPGEGDDVIDGEAGIDTLAFDGSGADEVIEIVADGPGAVLLRDVAAVRMDMVDLERIDLRVFGGADSVRVGDLTGTGLAEIVIDLSGQDGVTDFITIEGGAGEDAVTIGVDGAAIVIGGLAATIRLIGVDPVLDRLVFNGLGGDDVIDATGHAGVDLIVLGGDGDDVILGSSGADALSGDAGDDVILAGAGNDQVFGDVGDDILDGGAGFDALNGGPGLDALLNGESLADIDAATAFLF